MNVRKWIIFLLAGTFFFLPSISSLKAEEAATPQIEISKDLKKLLQERMDWVRQLIQEPLVLEAVQKGNQEHPSIGANEIEEKEKQWKAAQETDPLIQNLITNSCGEKLLQFQKKHPEFAEIFVTDSKGFNVCQTGKTSDYYQADEDWWVQGYGQGKGKAFHGTKEYDESADSESISIYLPVRGAETGQALGVCKAVIAISLVPETIVGQAIATTPKEAKSPNKPEPLVSKPGKLHVYRIIKADEGPYKGQLVISLGFSNYYRLGDMHQFKEGGLVQATPIKDSGQELAASYHFYKSERLKPDDLYTYTAYVTEVIDGDTVVTMIDLGFGITLKQKLRLRGLDAPLIESAEGRESKAFLEKRLAETGGKILIKTTKSDKYERYLVDIWSGEDYLNQELLDKNLAVRANS